MRTRLDQFVPRIHEILPLSPKKTSTWTMRHRRRELAMALRTKQKQFAINKRFKAAVYFGRSAANIENAITSDKPFSFKEQAAMRFLEGTQ